MRSKTLLSLLFSALAAISAPININDIAFDSKRDSPGGVYSFWVTHNDPFLYAPIMNGPDGAKVVSGYLISIDALVPADSLVTNEGQAFFTYETTKDQGLIVYDYNTTNDGFCENIYSYTKNGIPFPVHLVTRLDLLGFSDGLLTAQVTAVFDHTFPHAGTQFIAQWDYRGGIGSTPDPIVIGVAPEPGAWALSLAGLVAALAAKMRRQAS